MRDLRVALVHDWLASHGGSEQVLLELHRIFPAAPVYTSVYEPSRLPPAFAELEVRTSFLQRIPGARRRHQAFLPLMPAAFAQFDLRGFDLVLSDCHACCKGVITGPETTHICYCYTPIRYAWSHQEQYLARAPLAAVTARLARPVLASLREWDFVAAQGVDRFIADCENVRGRIAKYYRRESDLVHPPVDVERFRPGPPPPPDAPYLVIGRLVPYKRLEVAVEACSRLGLPLRVVGRGPELARLRQLAGPTVVFSGQVSNAEVESAYRECRAVLFPSDEDFGLVPLEAMASGRPVIALDLGGARETIIPGVTGILYPDGGVEELIAALKSFDPGDFDPAAGRARAEQFSPERFREGILRIVQSELERSPAERSLSPGLPA